MDDQDRSDIPQEDESQDDRFSQSNPSSNERQDRSQGQLGRASQSIKDQVHDRLNVFAKKKAKQLEEKIAKRSKQLAKRAEERVAKQTAKKGAEKLAKQGGKQLARKGAQAAASAAAGVSSGGITLAIQLSLMQAQANLNVLRSFLQGDFKQAAKDFSQSPLGLAIFIIIGLFLFIVIIVIIIIMLMFMSASTDKPTLKLTKEGPTQAKAGELLQYKISVSDTREVREIIVRDPYPEGTEYVSSSGNGEYNPAGRIVTWKASENAAKSGEALTKKSFTFNLTLRATRDNNNVINWAEATATYATPNTLKLQKEGPATAKTGDLLKYKITASDSRSVSEIIVTDPIPDGTDYVSSSGKGQYNAGAKTVTWKASESTTQSGGALAAESFVFTLTLRATRNNSNIVNRAKAAATYTSSQPNSGGGRGNPTATERQVLDFYNTIAGQGRNTGVLGDENTFVQTIMKRAGQYALGGKEAYLRKIYQKSVAAKVNPLILVVIWGVEQGWAINGTEYGCIHQRGSGFDSQLTCRVNEINHFMKEFEQKVAKDGLPFAHPVAPRCTYTDPFVYAYEKGTPVCAVNDSNGTARKNFVEFYKSFVSAR